jgi:hypothetical protein
MEDLDEGRVSNHPSTMASAAKSGGNVSVAIVNGKS